MILALLACATDSGVEAAPEWRLVARDEPGALLSLAAGPLVVGADARHGPAAWSLEGELWSELPLDTEGDLWWAASDSSGTWLVGEAGRVLRVEEDVVRRDVLGEDTLFGVWGDWVVGDSGLWEFDGEGWTRLREDPLFKVWSDGDEAFAVGPEGRILRFDGSEWSAEDSGTDELLVSVTGNDGRIVAVGGDAQGLVLERIDGGWVDISPEAVPPLAGVALETDCMVVTGRSGTIRIDRGDGWEVLGIGTPTVLDLHDVQIDADGVWVVGGALAEDPMSHGIVGLYGTKEVPLLDDPRSRETIEEEDGGTDRFRDASASCADGVHTIEVEVGGRLDAADLYLYGPADLVEGHEMQAVEWHAQYVWSRLEAVLVAGQDTNVTCEAEPTTWVVELEDGCGVFGDEVEPHSDCSEIGD
ncbi:MAG TPA: hypothetical protein QGF58_21715 [Myxococcota bacterium]|nr:hypothetical protein [Myxococcota bacterium]